MYLRERGRGLSFIPEKGADTGCGAREDAPAPRRDHVDVRDARERADRPRVGLAQRAHPEVERREHRGDGEAEGERVVRVSSSSSYNSLVVVVVVVVVVALVVVALVVVVVVVAVVVVALVVVVVVVAVVVVVVVV